MRVLILSESINYQQRSEEGKYYPPYTVSLEIADPNKPDGLHYSIFDYDVSIVHISKPTHDTIGYYENLPKILHDTRVALEHGRSVICLPASENFMSRGFNNWGMKAYDWIENLGLPLNDNEGEDINPSRAGRSKIIQDYLSISPRYYQIIQLPNPSSDEILAVVDNTEIVVGIAHMVLRGRLVILPPPLLHTDSYILSMSRLIDVSQFFYEKMLRRVPIADAPDWLDKYLSPEAKDIEKQIEDLEVKRTKHDQIAYVLYGTGEELEECVKILLEDLGLEVDRQPTGSNIDLKANQPTLGISFAIEVTGTRGIIRKDSNKVSQCWQHISYRTGTDEESERLAIIANTECHLDPDSRRSDCFSEDVAQLLGTNGVLLINTYQLYKLWREVQEEGRSSDEVIKKLHESSGVYSSK